MSAPVSREAFIARIKAKYGDNIQVLEYRLASQPVLFKCTRCGSTWREEPSVLLKRAHGGIPVPCRRCDRHLRKFPNYRKSTPTRDEHEQLLEQLYAGRIKLIGPYARTKQNTYKCDNPEHPAFQAFASKMEQQRDCAWCRKGICTAHNRLSQEQYVARVRSIHGDAIEVVGKYTGMKNKVEVRCLRHPEHGTWTPPAVNLVHEQTGCPKCVLYKYEEPIAELLTELKVPFEYNRPHGNCISPFSDKPLRYDFILEADPIVFIELDGVHHFADISSHTAWSNSLEAVQARDKVKDDYVRSIGGILIRASGCRQSSDRHISMELLKQLLRQATSTGKLDPTVLAPYNYVRE